MSKPLGIATALVPVANQVLSSGSDVYREGLRSRDALAVARVNMRAQVAMAGIDAAIALVPHAIKAHTETQSTRRELATLEESTRSKLSDDRMQIAKMHKAEEKMRAESSRHRDWHQTLRCQMDVLKAAIHAGMMTSDQVVAVLTQFAELSRDDLFRRNSTQENA